MAISALRSASGTKTDAVPRPVAAGVWRFDVVFGDFSSITERTSLSLRATGHDPSVTDVIILGAWAEVTASFTGAATITLDIGDAAGPANAYMTAADVTGAVGPTGATADARGAALDGRLALLTSDLLATITVAGATGADLSAGAASIYVHYVEVEHSTHQTTPGDTPAIVTDPGNEALPPVPRTSTLVEADATSSPVTVLLPTSVTGDSVVVVKIDASGNLVTVDGNGTTINGSSTVLITSQYDSLTFVLGATEWRIA